MVALIALVGVFAWPPAAYVDTGARHVPLAVSSWCSGLRCGAPIAASQRTAVVRKGAVVHVVFRFDPTDVRVWIGAGRARATAHGHGVSWRATRAGGITVRAFSPRGWVTYVGRLRVR